MTDDVKIDLEVSEYKESICPETYSFSSHCTCPRCASMRRQLMMPLRNIKQPIAEQVNDNN